MGWFKYKINTALGGMFTDAIISSASSRDHKDTEKLRKLQDAKYIKVDELRRIKAAFAEGYLAGNDQKPQGKAIKALKFTQEIISTLLLVVFLVAIMGAYKSTTDGSMFKIQLGDRIQVDPEEIHVTFNDVKGKDTLHDYS